MTAVKQSGFFVLAIAGALLASCSTQEISKTTGDLGSVLPTSPAPAKPSTGTGKTDTGMAAGAAVDLFKAATLTDAEVQNVASQVAKKSDSKAKLAPTRDKYSKRLARLTDKHRSDDGLNLNYRVYLSKQVNAFALADGSIRFYSGLMDLMTDDELLFVLGHEIGHVKEGHSKAALQTAYAASAARKAAASRDNTLGALADSQLGDLVEKLVNAQHSQGQENSSDDYGMAFLKKHKYKTSAAASALKKLAKLGDKSSMFASHPAPGERAVRMQKLQ